MSNLMEVLDGRDYQTNKIVICHPYQTPSCSQALTLLDVLSPAPSVSAPRRSFVFSASLALAKPPLSSGWLVPDWLHLEVEPTSHHQMPPTACYISLHHFTIAILHWTRTNVFRMITHYIMSASDLWTSFQMYCNAENMLMTHTVALNDFDV